LTLTGKADTEGREFVYEVDFARKTSEEKAFVEALWARRKVGYLLDQIRANGEKAELKDEVIKLAKKHGITTPYTSYLVVPDNGGAVANGTIPNSTIGMQYNLQGMNVTNTTNINNSTSAPRINYAPVYGATTAAVPHGAMPAPVYMAQPCTSGPT